jgi:hypothetical protein
MNKAMWRALAMMASFLLAVSAPSAAGIPPPQPFGTSPAVGAKTTPLKVISASDSVFRGQEEHPAGAVVNTDRYCSAVIDIFAGPGAKAAMYVMGTSDVANSFGVAGRWISEVAPIEINNTGSAETLRSLVVPLRHVVTTFFLSTTGTAVPDVNVSVGGSIIVYATGVPCLAGTPGW